MIKSPSGTTGPSRVNPTVDDSPILSLDAVLEIHYNPDVGSKVFIIVSRTAGGPICRLCVDGTAHHPHGRSHKHRLGSADCPKQNLRTHVEDRADLSGKSIEELFGIFCKLASITHDGKFSPPEVS